MRKSLLFIFLVAAAFALFLHRESLFGPGASEEQIPPPRISIEIPPGPPVPEVAVKPSGRVAIVIDDMGRDLSAMERLIGMEVPPVTIAILPYLKHSKDVANLAHEGGFEALLHVPMEPKNMEANDPGKGALLVKMDIKDIRSALIADLDEIPYVTGVNNHMGSRFTEDASLMKEVMSILKDRGLFFLDSKTTEKSKALSVAGAGGVKSAGRDVFLDNEQDKEYIKGQFREIIRIAKKRGRAIAIGHPHAETLDALEEMIPEFEREAIEIVRVGELIE